MTTEDLKAKLDLIAAKAKDLRAAGVTALSIGDLSLELAEAEPPQAELDLTEDDHTRRGKLLSDPDLHGGRRPRRKGSDPSEDDR